MSLTQRRKGAKESELHCAFASLRESHPGEWMHAFATELFPICRSITGDGLRVTLRRIQQEIPLTIHEVRSGTDVFDWTVPDEWNIRDAWIENSSGKRVIDFQQNNLHVVNYSTPVRARLSLKELGPRLHTLPSYPNWIPYRTSYYKRDWGFCLSEAQRQGLVEDEYEVGIDSTLSPGALSYGELLIRGETEDEFLISSHCCHPSLANDNLSGIAVAVALARHLSEVRTRHSFRFLFAPGTIGAIAWLARNESHLGFIKHGLVLTCVGDRGAFTYKQSRQGHAPIDEAVAQVLNRSAAPHKILSFSPYGYDERQFCSPGFNLPIGCFMRSQHGTFPEYHTSADNLDFITPAALQGSFTTLRRVIELVESRDQPGGAKPLAGTKQGRTSGSRFFQNLRAKGEPQLGKHGVYDALNGDVTPALWVLNFSDGDHSLESIATRAALPFDSIEKAADVLAALGLVKEVGTSA